MKPDFKGGHTTLSSKVKSTGTSFDDVSWEILKRIPRKGIGGGDSCRLCLEEVYRILLNSNTFGSLNSTDEMTGYCRHKNDFEIMAKRIEEKAVKESGCSIS